MIVEARIDNETHQMRITRERTARLSDKQRLRVLHLCSSGSRSRILCIFNLIDSAQNSLKIRGELVESPHPYGQVAPVAISRINAIVLDV